MAVLRGNGDGVRRILLEEVKSLVRGCSDGKFCSLSEEIFLKPYAKNFLFYCCLDATRK